MTCITKLLELKGDKEFLPINDHIIIEGGGNYKGYEYLIVFTERGHRCGYVAIPSGQKYNIDEIHCHGGITFEDDDHSAKRLLPVRCNDTWIGFDAMHYLDTPCRELSKKYFGHNQSSLIKINLIEEICKEVDKLERADSNSSHKTFEFMENECKSIIEQLTPQAPSLQELQNTSKQC